jgi:hypothetical protein
MARKEPKPAAAMASAGASWRKLGPARELEAEQSSGTTKNSEEDVSNLGSRKLRITGREERKTELEKNSGGKFRIVYCFLVIPFPCYPHFP